jgi:hypothetical protein
MNPLNNLIPIINAHLAELKTAGVISIRPGYRLQNGWPTKDPAIVVIVSKNAPDISLPSEIQGVPIDIRKATDVEELRFREPEKFSRIAAQRAEFRAGAFPEVDPVAEEVLAERSTDLEAAKPQIPYTPPAGVLLNPVSGNFPLTCHASPDAGWPTLRAFLAGTGATLTVGMYDFTSKHILDEVNSDLLGKRALEMVLDNPAKNPTADQTDTQTLKSLGDELGGEFLSAWALVRSNRAVHRWIYPTAYHIKVAVRDSQVVWLSSGNWNNSNQPDMDPIDHPNDTDQDTARRSDRDWHVIIEEPRLAEIYEAFLKHDFDVASSQASGAPTVMVTEVQTDIPPLEAVAQGKFQFHKPLRIENESVTITPLLTPDPGIYQPAMLRLVQSAQQKLYIQLQYIHPSDKDEDADFTALLNAVIDRIQAGVDVRIILSQWQLSHGWLERLQAAGIDLGVVKIQNGVHNKGFVVDSKVAALGSQNWSAEGALRNRDASVIVENEKAANYYEQIFLHDWDRIAKQTVHQ